MLTWQMIIGHIDAMPYNHDYDWLDVYAALIKNSVIKDCWRGWAGVFIFSTAIVSVEKLRASMANAFFRSMANEITDFYNKMTYNGSNSVPYISK